MAVSLIGSLSDIDLSFLYGWEGYYVIQGFWLDVRYLIAHADIKAVIGCFIVLLAAMLFFVRKQLLFRDIAFATAAALYGTFLLTVTVLGRTAGSVSSWDQLLLTYQRALSGEEAAQFDIYYNIVLYIPVGLFLFRCKNTKINVLILAVMPLSIELIQLITTRGIFELTDIINNFFGGLTGLAVARIISLLFDSINHLRKGGKVERTQ